MKRWLVAVLLLPALTVRADTILLKNGAWIDGRVTMRTDTCIQIQIGKIGKIELPVEEIHLIEKNNRTGEEMVNGLVEPKGKVEVPVPKGAQKPGIPAPDAKDGEKAAKAPSAEKDPKAGPEAKDARPAIAGKPAPEESSGSEGDTAADATGGKAGEEEASGSEEKKPDIDPDLKKRIEALVEDLQKDKSRNRVQAERHLEAIGQPAIPYLIPVAKSPSDLTRIAVMRLFHSFGDQQVIDTAIGALLDENEFVRDFGNRTLKRVTGEDFGFQSNSSPRRRELSQAKWVSWWAEEKKTLAEYKKLSEKSR